MKKWIYIIGVFLFSLPLHLGAQTDFLRPVSPSTNNDTLCGRAKILHAAGRDKEAIRYLKNGKGRT